MIKPISAALFATLLAIWGPAHAQQQQMLSPGARAGNSIIPSTHSPGCGGVLCDSDDPRRAANVQPPPCQGLICGLTPYGMTPPTTAAEAARAQDERARAEAAAPVAPPPAEKNRKSRKAKARSAKTVAARTPDLSSTAPQPAR